MKSSKLYFQRRQVQRFVITKRKPRVKPKKSWRVTVSVVPIIVSTTALVISGLSYWNQRQSTVAASKIQQASEARLITPVWNANGSTMTIQNLGDTSIDEIDVYFYIDADNFATRSASHLTTLQINVDDLLPPCSSLEFKQDQASLKNELRDAAYLGNAPKLPQPNTSNLYYDPEPVAITFFDAQGNFWIEDPTDGHLEEGRSEQDQQAVPGVSGSEQAGLVVIKAAIKANNCQ